MSLRHFDRFLSVLQRESVRIISKVFCAIMRNFDQADKDLNEALTMIRLYLRVRVFLRAAILHDREDSLRCSVELEFYCAGQEPRFHDRVI